MKTYILILCSALLMWSSCGDGKRERRSSRREKAAENENVETTTKADVVKTYAFDMGKERYEIELGFQEKLVDYFAEQPKVYTYRGNTLPDDWETAYYNMFISNKKGEEVIKDILKKIKALKPDMTEVEYVAFLAAFVQGSLEYDWDSYYDVKDKLNYPYEALYKQKGVCSDKSLIMGELLAELDYDVVFMTFEKANHMAVGIRVPQGYGSLGTEYAFIESTAYSTLGRVPKSFVGGVKIEEAPNLIPIEKAGRKVFEGIVDYKAEEAGTSDKYGEYYNAASANEKILLEEMHELKTDIQKLKEKLENLGCKGSVAMDKIKYCNKFNRQVNEKIDLYNEKVKEYNVKK